MVRLRLTRTGRKNYATYRIVAVDGERKRDGKVLEYLGFYLPHEKQLEVNKERALYWLSVGAQPSETVRRLLEKAEVLKKSAKKEKKYSEKPGQKSLDRRSAKEEKKAKKEYNRRNQRPKRLKSNY
jgi:small subunit ribosomal protein S16